MRVTPQPAGAFLEAALAKVRTAGWKVPVMPDTSFRGLVDYGRGNPGEWRRVSCTLTIREWEKKETRTQNLRGANAQCRAKRSRIERDAS
jgi:hypothetical protein